MSCDELGVWGKWGSVKGLSQTCEGLLDKLGLVINYLFLFCGWEKSTRF